MVNLPVDEAYALDYYAILRVKADNGLDVSKEMRSVESSLREQIPNLDSVLCSREFLVLCRANQATFEAVAKCGKTPVQVANYCRFTAKRRIQKRFWPTSKLTERKRRNGI